jgi:hypothetical protein
MDYDGDRLLVHTVDSASPAFFLAIDVALPVCVPASAMTTGLASGDRRWLLPVQIRFCPAPLFSTGNVAPIHFARLIIRSPRDNSRHYARVQWHSKLCGYQCGETLAV